MSGDGAGIKGFVEASFLDWPGRVAGVLFLPGCNFRCPFCHNHPLVLTPQNFEDIPFEYVAGSLVENEGWVDGLVVTGGEPTVFPGILGLLSALKEMALPVKLDTNGSNPAILKELIEKRAIDAAAMDIKAELSAPAYSKAAGAAVDISRISESIRILAESGLDVSFRATVVPGLHDEASVRAMAGAVRGCGLLLQNFRPADALDPEYRKIKPFTSEELRRLQEMTVI